MFKLVVLSALLAVASAGVLHGAAPLAYAAGPAFAYPTAVSHQSRTDVVSKPVVATYAAYAAPAVAAYAAPAVQTYAAAPVAYSAPAIAVPSAVSHQSRTDVISKPVVATYAAPAVATYAAAPAVHAYAAAPAWAGYGYHSAPIAYSAGYGYGHGYY